MSSKYRRLLPISGLLDVWTLGSFSLLVSYYKTNKKTKALRLGQKIQNEQNVCFQRQHTISMQESYLDRYLNLILNITKVLSSIKLLLYSIKTNKTQRKVFFAYS